MKSSRKLYKPSIALSVITIFIILSGFLSTAKAQEAELILQIEGNPVLQSPVINATTFLSREDKSMGLFSIFIQNQSNVPANDLYIDFQVSSEKYGLIWHQYQANGRPFSLNASQQVYSPNINAMGLPGTGEQIILEGGIQPGGEKLLNSMKGSTQLPRDSYTIEVCVYQGGNALSGGTLIDCGNVSFGTTIVQNAGEIYLTSPGDVVGSNSEISTVYPYFSWSGLTGVDYRLIVVEAQPGRSAASLINSALSSAPIIVNNTSGSGSLLTFESVDAVLSTTGYQFPVAGTQNLEAGKMYYWQVFAEMNEGSGETVASEIWSFSVAENAGVTTGVTFSGEIIAKLIGQSKYDQLKKQGYSLAAVEVDGTVYTLQQIKAFLEQFNIKIEQEKVSIINN